MPGPLRVLAYRYLLGYRIGRRVKLGLGGVIIGKSVDIGDDVEIGFGAVVQGKTITIGRHSSVGTMSYVSCETIEIGEDARIREQVYVGGPMLPESRFALGNRTIVLQMAFINPTKPVVIGDDTGIGGHCLIFTHGSWLNILDGYPVTYEPVTLGKSVWLPWRVFVMPGAVIGDGSVIGANSLVTGTIPPNSLALGSPAKVIKSAPDFPKTPSAEQRAALVAMMMAEFDRFVTYGGAVLTVEGAKRMYAREGRSHKLVWLTAGESDVRGAGMGDTVLSESALPAPAIAELRGRGAHWLDLGAHTRSEAGSALTEELAAFLGRYGIRLVRDKKG